MYYLYTNIHRISQVQTVHYKSKKVQKKVQQISFLRNLRESLGIENQWKMAQRLNIQFGTYHKAEERGGIPSNAILGAMIKVFGWGKIAPELKAALLTESDTLAPHGKRIDTTNDTTS